MARRPSILVLTTVAVALPVVVVSAAMVWLVGRAGRDVSDELREQFLTGIIRQAELDLGDYLAGATRVSQRHAEAVRTGVLRIEDLAAWTPELRLDVSARVSIESMALVQRDGGAAWAWRTGPAIGDVRDGAVSDAAHLRRAAWYQTGNASADPVWAVWPEGARPGGGPGPALGLVRRIDSADGGSAVLGVCVMSQALARKLAALRPTPDSVLYLVQPNDQILAASDPPADRDSDGVVTLWDASDQLARIVRQDAELPPPGRSAALAGGVEPLRVRAGQVNIAPGVGLRLVAVVPERAFMLEADRAVHRAVTLAVVAAAVALAAGLLLARALARPVKATGEVARRIEQGQFGISPTYPTPAREWEDLKRALTGMSAKLEDRERLRGEIDRAALELRLSEARYRSLFEDAPEGILVISAADATIRDVNGATCRLTGWPRSRLIGLRLADLSAAFRSPVAQDAPDIEHAMRQAAELGRSEYRVTLTRAGGERLVVQVVMVPHVGPDQATIRMTVMDVTALVQATEALESLNAQLEQRVRDRTVQLEAANRELEAFTYSVSHDLRAPLRHINGFVQLLDKQLGDRGDPTARRYMGVIAESTGRMGRLIDDLLAFSKVVKTEPRHQPVEMGKLAAEARGLVENGSAGRVDWQIGDLPVVDGDPGLLRQVWTNLLDNAVKYSGKLERAQIRVGARREGPQWVFFVADNGAGFDPRYAGRLFGVFQRLHADSEYPGTGIGLATVQRIVARHGGRTWAEGEVGKGATFYFSLPADTAENHA